MVHRPRRTTAPASPRTFSRRGLTIALVRAKMTWLGSHGPAPPRGSNPVHYGNDPPVSPRLPMTRWAHKPSEWLSSAQHMQTTGVSNSSTWAPPATYKAVRRIRIPYKPTKSAGGDPRRPRRLQRCVNQDCSRGRNYTSNQGGHATFNGSVRLDTSGTRPFVGAVPVRTPDAAMRTSPSHVYYLCQHDLGS